jgi:hypothetical protein
LERCEGKNAQHRRRWQAQQSIAIVIINLYIALQLLHCTVSPQQGGQMDWRGYKKAKHSVLVAALHWPLASSTCPTSRMIVSACLFRFLSGGDDDRKFGGSAMTNWMRSRDHWTFHHGPLLQSNTHHVNMTSLPRPLRASIGAILLLSHHQDFSNIPVIVEVGQWVGQPLIFVASDFTLYVSFGRLLLLAAGVSRDMPSKCTP